MTHINISCIVVTHSLADDLRNLVAAGDESNVTWQIFQHSDNADVDQACFDLLMGRGRKYGEMHCFSYKTNRGLSRSWNDGIYNAYTPGSGITAMPPFREYDVVIIINDDMLPGTGDIQKVAQAAMEHPECGIIKCMGLDKRSGQRTSMEFGLTAITKRGWEVVGCFDENIAPIYWEDIDWDRRRTLAGLPAHMVEDTNAVHQGSKTSLVVPDGVALAQQAYDRNQRYYLRKWGGTHLTGEQFESPFDNPAFGLKIAPEQRDNPYPGYGVK